MEAGTLRHAGLTVGDKIRTGRATSCLRRNRCVRAYDPYVAGAAVVSGEMSDEAEVHGVVVGATGELIVV